MTDFSNITQVNAILRFVKNCDAWPQLKVNHQINAWKEVHRLLEGNKPAPEPELPLIHNPKERR